jgi:predicted peroxiredoxin
MRHASHHADLTAAVDSGRVGIVATLAIVGSTGVSDPTRASIPFHIAANGAAASGVEVMIILAGDATELLREGVAAGVKGVGIPPLAALLEKCAEAKIPIHV